MSRVRRSTYRQPLTPKGIERLEQGKLQWFDPEMFMNFNTGALEQYLDEKNRIESFKIPAWDWKKVIIAVLIGALFAMVNQYVGLKVGMVVAGSWYMVYLLGMAARWNPPTLNIAATASNGAAMICTGFVFTFPAIYILALDPAEKVDGKFLIEYGSLSSLMPIAIISVMIAGILGVMYFIIFRRIWLVEDPLPTPGFEAMVKLLDLSRASSAEATAQARSSVRQAFAWIGGTAAFTFFRDFPLFDWAGKFKLFNSDMSIMDWVAMKIGLGNIYYAGNIMFTPRPRAFLIELTLIPIQFGLGWFMKAKTAGLIFLGTAFAWFVVVPIAVWTHAPYFWANSGEFIDVALMDMFFGVNLMNTVYEGIPTSPAFAAFSMARVMAIGCILGGGMTALIKMLPVFKTVFTDLFAMRKESGENKAVYIKGQGWYEWPSSHILLVAFVTFLSVWIIFVFGGFNFVASGIFSLLLVFLTFLLGAIAVKVMGETGTEPVSATSFLVLLILMLVFSFVLPIFGIDMSQSQIIIMSLAGTTVFGAAISMSGDVVMNFKIGLYTGNRPQDLVKALTIGIIPGAIISGVFAVIFSIGLGNGTLNLAAPQAHAFTIFVKGIIANAIQWKLFFAGVFVGVFLELLIGMGTAFGLGMYLPLGIQIPMLGGGIARDVWEKRYLEPAAKRNNWGEDMKTFKIMGTYMMATGLMVGEAVLGTIVALWIVVPNLGEVFGG
ncbi:MAG: OPT/YSL family transporter [Candidatus Thermoplasmatota archaeon]|nr:OPT/YSL family transporter [Candidatus Thermoplasmatota archaeon]